MSKERRVHRQLGHDVAAAGSLRSQNPPNRLSLDRAYRILEAPMRLLMAAERLEE